MCLAKVRQILCLAARIHTLNFILYLHKNLHKERENVKCNNEADEVCFGQMSCEWMFRGWVSSERMTCGRVARGCISYVILDLANLS